jgi:hypothetical protein
VRENPCAATIHGLRGATMILPEVALKSPRQPGLIRNGSGSGGRSHNDMDRGHVVDSRGTDRVVCMISRTARSLRGALPKYRAQGVDQVAAMGLPLGQPPRVSKISPWWNGLALAPSAERERDEASRASSASRSTFGSPSSQPSSSFGASLWCCSPGCRASGSRRTPLRAPGHPSQFRIRFPLMRAVRVYECERPDVADELRDAKRVARRELRLGGTWKKADLARVIVEVLANERGPHGDGFMTGPSGFGAARWFFRCGGCGGRAVFLYKPPGAESFACRRCWRLAYPKSRITLGIGKVLRPVLRRSTRAPAASLAPRRHGTADAPPPRVPDACARVTGTSIGWSAHRTRPCPLSGAHNSQPHVAQEGTKGGPRVPEGEMLHRLADRPARAGASPARPAVAHAGLGDNATRELDHHGRH